MKISFIGFGNMAKAIAESLVINKQNQLHAAAPSLPIGINSQGIHTHYDNLAVSMDADILILAVKPAQMAAVFAQIKDVIPHNCLLISIAAGLSLSWFARYGNFPLVRAMPNIAVAVCQGATTLIGNKFVSTEQHQMVEQVFKNLGITAWVSAENEMDIFTALSGSGPAYVFLFMEAMIKAATSLGLDEHTAKSFTLQTFKGALSMAAQSDLSLSDLRKKVTSPAGTTATAIEVLTKQGLEDTIFTAMKAACDRAHQLNL